MGTGGVLMAMVFAAQALQYPTARRAEQVDDYHGTKVADPYRWLEDPDSPETRGWIKAENALTEAYLAGIPERGAIRDRLTQLWNYPRFGAPVRKGRFYLYLKNDGLQNQPVLYRQAPDGPAEVLLDLNAIAPAGTLALSTLALSEDGELIVYGTQQSGSDWEEYRVREVATGKDRPDVLRWVKFSAVSWTHDGKGFFYSRYPEPTDDRSVNRFQKLYYHRLGTDQANDPLIYERPDQPDWGFGSVVSDDG